MFYLPEVVTSEIESILDEDILSVRPIGGGDINEARHITTHKGSFFLKMNNSGQGASILLAEQRGLSLLRESAPSSIHVPAVIGYSTAGPYACLVLEHIETSQPTTAIWQSFGRGLAALHRNHREVFGLDHNNFIGHLPQVNTSLPDWPAFYFECRLQPQGIRAYEKRLLELHDMQKLESLANRLGDYYPAEAPSLIHGDLWSGNFLIGAAGRAVLIDPSVSYSHREMDLAMSRLFGGFPSIFYDAYHEASPLAPGWEERLELGQLYYLLAHLNMFGRSYLPAVKRILKKWA